MVLAPEANLAVIAIGNAQAVDEFYSSDMATDVLGMFLASGTPAAQAPAP